MATENDQKRWAMAAMEKRLAVAKAAKQAQLLQQQQQLKIKKEGKEASVVDVVSSKEPDKVVSLPKTNLFCVDSKEEDFVAYRKLSHPVDENLLVGNVKFSSAKGTIADKVLRTLLRSGDSAPKHLLSGGVKREKKIEDKEYILLDNFEQPRSSSSSSSKKAYSKRSKCRMSMKRLKKSGAFDLPQHLRKFDLYKPMHGLWESYMMRLVKETGQAQLGTNLLSVDLHGAFMFVAECKVASFTGVQGIMVRETSQTFGIITRNNKFRVVPKKISVFIIQLECWKITIHGDKFTSRDNVLQR